MPNTKNGVMVHYATNAKPEHYQEHGFFIREDVFSNEEVVALREGAESAPTRPADCTAGVSTASAKST